MDKKKYSNEQIAENQKILKELLESKRPVNEKDMNNFSSNLIGLNCERGVVFPDSTPHVSACESRNFRNVDEVEQGFLEKYPGAKVVYKDADSIFFSTPQQIQT